MAHGSRARTEKLEENLRGGEKRRQREEGRWWSSESAGDAGSRERKCYAGCAGYIRRAVDQSSRVYTLSRCAIIAYRFALLFTTSSFTNILRPPPRVLESLSLSLYFSPFVFSWLSVRMITVPIRLGHASIVASARRVRSRTRARTCHRRCVVDKRGVEFERSREPKNVDNVVDSNGEKIAPR